VSAGKITGRMVFLDRTISDHHVKKILAQLTGLTEEENVGKSTTL
jgi:hypothetical protein